MRTKSVPNLPLVARNSSQSTRISSNVPFLGVCFGPRSLRPSMAKLGKKAVTARPVRRRLPRNDAGSGVRRTLDQPAFSALGRDRPAALGGQRRAFAPCLRCVGDQPHPPPPPPNPAER